MRFALDALFADVPVEQLDEAREFYGARAAGRGPSSLEELNAARARRPRPPAADPPPVAETIDLAGVRVPVRIFTPVDAAPRGVHLDIHGGGFYLDSAAHGDTRNRELADARHLAVVSVDYRLAPEHPWPAAPTTAPRWRAGSSSMPLPASEHPDSPSADAQREPPSRWRRCYG